MSTAVTEIQYHQEVMGFPDGSAGKESACNAGDAGWIPGLGRSPRGGNGNLLQYSCLKNSIDRRAWWIVVPWGHKEVDVTERLNMLRLF